MGGHLFHQQKSRSLNKKLTFGPKYPNFGVKKAHFRPQRPIGASPINVFNTKKVSHWNPDTRVPKFLLPAPKKLDLGPKNGQIWSKICIFGHSRPNIAIFCTFCPMPDQKNNVNKVPRWVFCYVGNKTFDFSSKKRIFCPKTTKFGPKLAFLVNLGQAMQAYSVPCWWVGWWLWRAGCISQDTYLLYLYLIIHITKNTAQRGKK